MPRFHFDIRDGEEFADNDGHEFPDLYAAETHAILTLKALISWSGSDWGEQHAVMVRDDAGDPVLEASVRFEIKRFLA